MSDQSVNRLDASAVANVVNGVINALGLQPTYSSPHGSSDSNNTQNRRITSREPPTPSILGKRRRKTVAAKSSKIISWDREVVCLPQSYMDLFGSDGVLPIPRKKKDILASFGLVGKVHLESDWTAAEVVAEMKSTFSEMLQREDCAFKFLQFTGTGTKSLIVPKVSPSYKGSSRESRQACIFVITKKLDNESEIRDKMLGIDCNTMGNGTSQGKFGGELSNKDDSDPVDSWEPPPPPIVIHSQSSSSALLPLEQSSSGTVSVSRSGGSCINPHEEFIDLLSDSSEGDFDTQEAIQASLQQDVRNNFCTDTRSESTCIPLEEILRKHFNTLPGFHPAGDIENCNIINVRRNHIWIDALRAISKPAFNPLFPVRVTFISESAIDEGGPSRKFFSLALLKMSEDFFFYANAKLFTRNVQGLKKRLFFMAGMFVGLSLANGGPGLSCLSETVYSYLCYGLQQGTTITKVCDIDDVTVREHLLKICDAKDTTELCDLLMEDDARYIDACGILKPVFRVTTRDIPEITEAVCIEYLIMKSINELNQFQEGLNVLGVIDLIKDHPASCHELFVHDSKTVTPYDIDKLFLPLFSPEGSNAREDKEALILNWKDYIYKAEELGVSSTQILAFVTGAFKIPPMGFPTHPTITFITDKSLFLPTASTCALSLKLPLSLVSYESFKENMTMAILNTVGFGQV